VKEDWFDVWAHAFVARLVETGGIELRPRSDVTPRVAQCLANGMNIAAMLVDHPGVDELLADDETLRALLTATRPPSAVAAPVAKPRPEAESTENDPPAPPPDRVVTLSHFTRAAKAVIVAAQMLADERGHRDVTLWHVLAALIDGKALRMLGDPEAARVLCTERLGRMIAGDGFAALDLEVRAVIEQAEENAPNPDAVAPAELAMAALETGHEGFILAFRGRPAPPPRSADSEPPDEDDEKPEVPPERGPGRLVVSPEFEQAFRFAAVVARKEAEEWPDEPVRAGKRIPAAFIAEAESELETTFPDDFLAAANVGITQFADLGVTCDEAHGEPAKGHQVAERILEVASNAESEVPDSMVAIMTLSDPNVVTYVCIAKNVAWKGRNDQQVFLVELGGEPEPAGPFGALLLRLVRSRYEDVKDDGKPAPELIPRLIGRS
jgi:hypothetical protein